MIGEYGKPTKCRSCGADIVWVQTARRRRMPIEMQGWEEGERHYQHGKHKSHFANCPQPPEWRRRQP